MTAFYLLSPLARAAFAFWALSVCLVGILNAFLLFWKKRYVFGALSILPFAPAYLSWQVVFDLALRSRMGTAISGLNTTGVF